MPIINNKSTLHNDPWKIINTNDLPEGIHSIAMPSVEFIELLTQTTQKDTSHIIVPLNDKIQASGLIVEAIKLIEKDNKIGVWVDSEATTEQLDELLKTVTSEAKATTEEIQLIMIDVIDFNNGRAFSLAQHLRLQGYQNEIRLTGNFGIDQLAYYQRSGVNNFGMVGDNQTQQHQDDLKNAFNALATAPTGRTANELPLFRDSL